MLLLLRVYSNNANPVFQNVEDKLLEKSKDNTIFPIRQ
jgi:hypothetical protein